MQAATSTQAAKTQICKGCKGKPKPLNPKVFKIDAKGSYAKTCKNCQEREAKKYAQKKRRLAGDDEADDDVELSVLPVTEFSRLLGDINITEELEALVDIDSIVERVTPDFNLKQIDFDYPTHKDKWAPAFRKQADALAQMVWDLTGYRYVYQSSPPLNKECGSHIHYHCAQFEGRQKTSKKSKGEDVKHRDKSQMPSFACEGWLHVYVTVENPNVAHIKMIHRDEHIPYWRIDVPTEIKEFVTKNKEWPFRKVWSHILEKDPTPQFSRKQVANIWRQLNSAAYMRDDDELTSARKLLQEFATSEDERYRVEEVTLPSVDGLTGIAFVITKFLKSYVNSIREISLDSTWNTNGLNYECFALLGEVHGSGCPLGYLLMLSSGPDKGGKQEYIARLLRYVKDVWNIRPKITLTDKDWSEINACSEVFPEADHQLCYWHVLKAAKTRLAILRRQPRYYDAEEAKSEFDFIDTSFVPIGQMSEADRAKADTWVATNAIPRLVVLQGGVPRSAAPQPTRSPSPEDVGPAKTQPESTQRKLIVRHAGKVILTADLEKEALNDVGDDEPEEPDGINEGDDEGGIEGEDEDVGHLAEVRDLDEQADVMDEDGEILQQLDRRYKRGVEENIVSERAVKRAGRVIPEMDTEGEKNTKDPDYAFCPLVHRVGVLHLVTRHFVQHPFFPQRSGEVWSAERIRHESVYEAYTYCRQRGLREVWGYLWANWYSPKRWPLWARSTKPYLSRLRTTMNVENFWRQIKHRFLHDYARPRLDHLVYILVKTVTPMYVDQLNRLDDDYRSGRSRTLPWQNASIKKHWKRLEKAPVSAKQYDTNVPKWTCTCGQQKYESHHLCKHLVQAVSPPAPPEFFQEIYRRRVVPLYKHPLLDRELNNDDFDEGNVTDGDDRKIYGRRRDALGGGKWKGVLQNPAKRSTVNIQEGDRMLKRRRTIASSTPTSIPDEPSPPRLPGRSTTRPSTPPLQIDTGYRSDEVIDLSMSSPVASSVMARSSSHYSPSDSEPEARERDKLEEFAKDTVSALQEASKLIQGQLDLPGGASMIWLRALKRSNLGKDVKDLVNDIRKLKTGKKRLTTFGSKGEKGASRRVANTMGYRAPEEEVEGNEDLEADI